MKVSNHTDLNSLSARLRRTRMRYLDDLILSAGRSGLRLADLGGTRSFWEMNLPHLRCRNRLERIDLFNLAAEPDGEIDGIPVRSQTADIKELKAVPDGAYDIAFSNSALEHTGNFAEQYRAACEIRRISRAFVVQTPNRSFPLEPHFYVPFFNRLPLGLRSGLHQRLRLGWLPPEPDPLRARIDCDQIRLLSRKELRLLFPDARIFNERLLGLVKSFIAVCGAQK